MSTWGNPPYGDPTQQYYNAQPMYPSAGGYPPPTGGYPPPPGGYPPPPGMGGAYPPPPGAYPPPPSGGYGTPYGQSGPFVGMHVPPDPSAMYGGTNYNVEDPEMKGFDFTEKSVRRGFIRKVYSILMVQLLISMGFIALFMFHEGTRRMALNPALMIVAIVVLLVSMIALACCGEIRRKAPMNFILLFIFTLAESFFLGVISTRYREGDVLLAIGITCAVCLGLTLFAFQTKWDFTMMGGVLFVAVLILMLFGLILMFFPGKTAHLIYASLGAFLFSVYLVYDTQLMMGGKHKYSISPEEYIFAALNLYVDIVNIFIYILSIIGSSRD